MEFLRTNPCVDCGESDPLVLEFDHVVDKAFTIGEGLRDRNWKSVLDEIAKCDVVCATAIAVEPRTAAGSYERP
jgi:hypothetical protein